MSKVDFHIHSNASDGEQSTISIIRDALASGLNVISITDHNIVSVSEPEYHNDLIVIPGAELSTSYYSADLEETIEVHIVAIFPLGVNPRVIESLYSDQSCQKKEYIQAILSGLRQRGIEISMEEVLSAKRHGKNPGRHQVASVLVQKGIEPDVASAMDHWIGNRSPYYIPTTLFLKYPSFNFVISKIIENQGIPVLAHPFYYSLSDQGIDALVFDFSNAVKKAISKEYSSRDELLPAGLEVYYKHYMNDESRIHYLEKLQRKHGLYASAGSDHHRACDPFSTYEDPSLYDFICDCVK